MRHSVSECWSFKTCANLHKLTFQTIFLIISSEQYMFSRWATATWQKSYKQCGKLWLSQKSGMKIVRNGSISSPLASKTNTMNPPAIIIAYTAIHLLPPYSVTMFLVILHPDTPFTVCSMTMRHTAKFASTRFILFPSAHSPPKVKNFYSLAFAIPNSNRYPHVPITKKKEQLKWVFVSEIAHTATILTCTKRLKCPWLLQTTALSSCKRVEGHKVQNGGPIRCL